MSDMPKTNAGETAGVTVFHVGPQDHDLVVLANILDRTDWKMCPGTRWNLSATEDMPSATARLTSEKASIVLCERESAGGNWKDMLESVRRFTAPPMLIVTSRTADEYLWAEALNLGAYDVLSKPYYPAEVVRVLSMAWLHWMNRRPATVMAQAS
jgi:DNA-binding NtrC family response regulator